MNQLNPNYCCAAFAKQAGGYQAPVGGGGLYPSGYMPEAQFEQAENGTWNINGCCGGGCYVVSDMKFCPYCGGKLAQEQKP